MLRIRTSPFFTILAVIGLLALLPRSLPANAGVFDGGGANLRISQTEQIQMQSETVDIRFIPADGPVTGNLKHRDTAEYTC
ncbi:MAG: hypothetical protein ACQKBT_08955, partial [Puniceicoccales bacterium]